MLKKLLSIFVGSVNRILSMPEFQEEDIHVSWADFEEKGVPKILFYSIDTCNICKEIELWFSNNWIPHKYIKCKFITPARSPKMRNLMGFVGFTARNNNRKYVLFLHQNFPQIDLMDIEGNWTRHIGNSKNIRLAVEEFIVKNIKFFPGFEAGIYGDKSLSEQSAQQAQDNIKDIRRPTNG